MFNENRCPVYGQSLGQQAERFLSLEAAKLVLSDLSLCPVYRPTPLVQLPTMARKLGLGQLYVKDEAGRFSLGSFKALGGVHAVMRLALSEAERLFGRTLGSKSLMAPEVRRVASRMTFACATDGNHGRSVALGARLVGARAIIHVHSAVSAQRVNAIRELGAEVCTVRGNYDDAVAEVRRACAENEWTLVSDTSWPGYENVPWLVMQGYLALVSEILAGMDQPTHVFVQAGVGGLAAAVAGHMALRFGRGRPKLVVVEPANAACLFASNAKGRRVKIRQRKSTVMAMLECFEPSLVAWDVLSKCADAFMTIEDDDAVNGMKVLARPSFGDRQIISGESGAAGFAGLQAAVANAKSREALHLDSSSRVLTISTEGITDISIWRELTGMNPAKVS
jgi:diaminopropionate ammonia-lyase